MTILNLSHMNITVNKLDKYLLFNIKFLPNENLQQKINVRYIFVIDNSMSMGEYTRSLTNVIISGLIENSEKNKHINLFPSILISFSNFAQTLSKNIMSNSNINSIEFGEQGGTNIVSAIELAYEEIININKNNNMENTCQNILIFLSDGKHSFGIFPDNLDYYKNKFIENDIILSVINVAICTDNKIGNPMVQIGTKIKQMETLEMLGFDPIYFVSNHNEIEYVLKSLIVHLNFAFKTSNWIQMTLPNGEFFDGDMIITKSVSDSISVLTENTKNTENKIIINMCEYVAEETNISVENLYSMFEYYIPQLSKLAVTRSQEAIKKQLSVLDDLVNEFSKQSNLTKSGDTTKINYLRNIIAKMKHKNLYTPKIQATYMTLFTVDPIKKLYDKVLCELLEKIAKVQMIL